MSKDDPMYTQKWNMRKALKLALGRKLAQSLFAKFSYNFCENFKHESIL